MNSGPAAPNAPPNPAADRAAFLRELARLEAAGVLRLTPEQQAALSAHYQQTHPPPAASASDARTADAPASAAGQLGLGMKIASLLAALALSAAVFFFCHQFWGRLDTPAQLLLLVGGALLTTWAALGFAARRQDYFAKIFGMLACVCFGLNCALVGRIFNLPPRPGVLLLGACFAFLLAYACRARLLLTVAVCCLAAWLGAHTGTWCGMYWLGFGRWPETYFPAALAVFCLSLVPLHRAGGDWADFPPMYRIWGLLLFFLPLLVLANWGRGSLLPLAPKHAEYLYQCAGFVGAAGLMALGIRRNWSETTQTALVFFILFLYTKFFDWWWDWLPKYLFFLLIGLASVLALVVLQRLRKTLRQRAMEARP